MTTTPTRAELEACLRAADELIALQEQIIARQEKDIAQLLAVCGKNSGWTSLQQEAVRVIASVAEMDRAVAVGAHKKVTALRAASKQRAVNAANALHDKPGGNREKQAAVREAWASGKFKSRDVCAEQECAAIGMSMSAARKALRGTPDPTPVRCNA